MDDENRMTAAFSTQEDWVAYRGHTLEECGCRSEHPEGGKRHPHTTGKKDKPQPIVYMMGHFLKVKLTLNGLAESSILCYRFSTERCNAGVRKLVSPKLWCRIMFTLYNCLCCGHGRRQCNAAARFVQLNK